MPSDLSTIAQFLQGPGVYLFDYDGVVGNTEADVYDKLFEKYLAEEKDIDTSDSEFQSKFKVARQNMFGKKKEDSAQALLIGVGVCSGSDDPNLAQEIADLLAWRKRPEVAQFLQAQAEHISLLEPTATLLRELHQQGRAGIVTSADQTLHTAKTKQHYWLQDVPVVTGDQVKHGKPHPEPYLKGAALLNTNPANCVAIEDALDGAMSAYEAGMKVLIVPNPQTEPSSELFRKLQAFAEKYPDRVLMTSLAEIEPIELVQALKLEPRENEPRNEPC